MRIKNLQLYTHQLEEQRNFYVLQLGLAENWMEPDAFSVQAGETELVFWEQPEPTYYHFAFNIPPYQYQAALDWLRPRVELLTDEGAELIDFSNWNAYAMYFWDAGGNIVEFIARRDVNLPAPEPFGPTNLQAISEIGLSVEDVGAAFDQLQETTGLPFYSGNRSNFCAAGDPNGLFIIVDKQRKSWYPTQRPAKFFPLKVGFSQAGKNWKLELREEGLALLKE